MAEPGPIVKASVGIELFGPKLPEKVLLLRIRQKPPVTVRDFGFSMVAVGWGAAAPAIKSVVANSVKKNCPSLVLSSMMSGIVNWTIVVFNPTLAYRSVIVHEVTLTRFFRSAIWILILRLPQRNRIICRDFRQACNWLGN